MNTENRELLKRKVLARNNLYELQGSRYKRLLKDPLRTLKYYIMQTVGYLQPYKVTYTTLWGSKMNFYLPEGGMVYYYGFWEANLTNFFINFLKEGDVFFDVGAHVGYYSILASDLVGENGKVYSFEPTPRTFASLTENANRKHNINAYNNAILNEETTIDFFDYGPKYSAFNTFKKRTGKEIFFKEDVSTISVKTISLDAFCKSNSVTPTFIKIDAEGSEHLILGAMSFLLDTIHPLITIEVSNEQDLHDNSIKSITILKQKNYQCFKILLDGTLEENTLEVIPKYDNFLFVHPTKRYLIKNLIS